MAEAIERLTFKAKQVRTIKRGDTLLWCAKDVCGICELSNPRDAIRSLDADEKTTVGISDSGSSGSNYKTRANFVTEPGLYKLIMRSNKPVAREFQRWVCHEVLPSIRRTGCYVMGGAMTGMEALDYEIRRKAEYEFRCAVQARALAMRNLHRSAEEERAITEAAILEEAKGTSLDIDTIERREPPEAAYRRMVHRVVMFGTSEPMSRLEEVQRKGGFLN